MKHRIIQVSYRIYIEMPEVDSSPKTPISSLCLTPVMSSIILNLVAFELSAFYQMETTQDAKLASYTSPIQAFISVANA